MVGVFAAVHRLCDQGAERAGAYVVARRARRGADADFHDSGRRAAEDGRLRHFADLLSDLSAGRLRPDVVRVHLGRGEHDLWRVCRDGADRFQANGGV